jgi:hypothetical protein
LMCQAQRLHYRQMVCQLQIWQQQRTQQDVVSFLYTNN